MTGMDTVTIERVSDGAVYQTNGRISDFNIDGEPVRMSREVTERWFRNAQFETRLVAVEEK